MVEYSCVGGVESSGVVVVECNIFEKRHYVCEHLRKMNLPGRG